MSKEITNHWSDFIETKREPLDIPNVIVIENQPHIEKKPTNERMEKWTTVPYSFTRPISNSEYIPVLVLIILLFFWSLYREIFL